MREKGQLVKRGSLGRTGILSFGRTRRYRRSLRILQAKARRAHHETIKFGLIREGVRQCEALGASLSNIIGQALFMTFNGKGTLYEYVKVI